MVPPTPILYPLYKTFRLVAGCCRQNHATPARQVMFLAASPATPGCGANAGSPANRNALPAVIALPAAPVTIVRRIVAAEIESISRPRVSDDAKDSSNRPTRGHAVR